MSHYFPAGKTNAQRKMLNKRYAMLEEGKAPVGVHQGKFIKDLNPKTLLYYCDKFEEADNSVYGCYIKACIDVALELGYVQERDKVREEMRKIRLLSEHVGEIGERIELECLLEGVYIGMDYTSNIMRCGSNIIKYFGASLGKAGDTIRIKCTIKRHDVYNDMKSTTISRPKLLGAEE